MRKLLFTVFLATFILPACGGTATKAPVTATPASPRATVTPLPPRPTPNAAELEISDPTKPIEVSAGNDFTITVRTHPSSEYHWEITETLDSRIVEYVWKDHIPDNPNAQNARGKDIWRFKAVAPGQTIIVLAIYQGQTVQTLEKLAFAVVVK